MIVLFYNRHIDDEGTKGSGIHCQLHTTTATTTTTTTTTTCTSHATQTSPPVLRTPLALQTYAFMTSFSPTPSASPTLPPSSSSSLSSSSSTLYPLSSSTSSSLSSSSSSTLAQTTDEVKREDKNNNKNRTVVAIVVPIVLACIISSVLFLFYRHRKKKKEISGLAEEDGNEMDYHRLHSPRGVSPSIPEAALNTMPPVEDKLLLSPVAKALKSCEVFDVIIGAELGAGAFGRVYQGEWNGAKVAVKALMKESYFAFLNEASVLKKLRHPNIVQFIGIYKNPMEGDYIVTEFVEGGNLEHLLRHRQDLFSKSGLVRLACEIASGMRLLEQKGIVHRDLASRNILVSISGTDYTAKVADFGMSRVAHQYYQGSKDSVFPIKWSAPEVLKQHKYSSKSDVWAMGVLLWEIFSFATVPYYDLTNKETVAYVMRGQRLTIPDDTPDKIGMLMMKCWEHEPLNRPTFVDIFNVLQGEMGQPSGSSAPVSEANTDSSHTDSSVLLQPQEYNYANPSILNRTEEEEEQTQTQTQEYNYANPSILNQSQEDTQSQEHRYTTPSVLNNQSNENTQDYTYASPSIFNNQTSNQHSSPSFLSENTYTTLTENTYNTLTDNTYNTLTDNVYNSLTESIYSSPNAENISSHNSTNIYSSPLTENTEDSNSNID